jgi:hypothetical protein
MIDDQDKALTATLEALATAVVALRQIARGHHRPLLAREAQEIARRTLIEIGSDWTKRGTETDPVS